jgi:hypothetical protein
VFGYTAAVRTARNKSFTETTPELSSMIAALSLTARVLDYAAPHPLVNSFPVLCDRAKILRVERDGVVQPNSFQIEGAEHITGLRLVVAVSSGCS